MSGLPTARLFSVTMLCLMLEVVAFVFPFRQDFIRHRVFGTLIFSARVPRKQGLTRRPLSPQNTQTSRGVHVCDEDPVVFFSLR